jgi:thioredoxin 1
LNLGRRLCNGPNSPVNARQIGTSVSHLTQLRLSRYRLHSAAAAALRDEGKALMSEFFEARIGLSPSEGTAMSSELIKHITDASFDADVLKSETPVLVDYWAEWCGPCKMIAPILDETAKELGGKLQIAKLNVDENRDVPAKYGIRGIPTLMLFKDGQLAATKVGALSKAQLTAFLQPHL